MAVSEICPGGPALGPYYIRDHVVLGPYGVPLIFENSHMSYSEYKGRNDLGFCMPRESM